MNLLFVIDSFCSGGAQRQMTMLAMGLHGRGHNVEFFVYYPQLRHFAEQVENAGIKIHVCQKKFRFSMIVPWKLRERIQKGKYDVVLSFLGTPNFISEISCMGIKNIKLVVSERCNFVADRLPLLVKIKKQFHRLSDCVTVNSHFQKIYMENEYKWLRGNIRTIYNGVDADTFKYKPLTPSKSASLLKLLVVASIVPKKNAIGLARALANYRDRFGAPPELYWVGRKISESNGTKYFDEVCRIIHDLGVEKSWRWLGERNDVPDLIGSCDALIHPSFIEGLPNIICEALSCGRPVLASSVNDNPRLIENGNRGFLFDPADPGDIADAIHRFAITNFEKRQEMGRQARLYAEKNLSMEIYVDRYEQLFQQLVGVGR